VSGSASPHHVEHWVDGGPTCLENLVLLCLHHHLVIHHDHWRLEMIDGLPWFTPPPWIDPGSTPNGVHDPVDDLASPPDAVTGASARP
jgi:hypothetical protein